MGNVNFQDEKNSTCEKGDGREEMEEERDMIPWNFNGIQNETRQLSGYGL
jgi:hypothetical protein